MLSEWQKERGMSEFNEFPVHMNKNFTYYVYCKYAKTNVQVWLNKYLYKKKTLNHRRSLLLLSTSFSLEGMTNSYIENFLLKIIIIILNKSY